MGVKEEVILTANVGKNAFSFLIETGGLTIAEENGSYYFFDPETETTVARLGAVIAYCNNEECHICVYGVNSDTDADEKNIKMPDEYWNCVMLDPDNNTILCAACKEDISSYINQNMR